MPFKDYQKGLLYEKCRRDQVTLKVYKLYGDKCNCCGELISLFLSLDHVSDNGKNERGNDNHNFKILSRLSKLSVPDPDYQILCMNCNFGKFRNRGICPHKTQQIKRKEVY